VTAPAALRAGATGASVRDLQQRLAALGIGHEPDDPGRFGLGTARAVRRFQGDRGLQVDGIVGTHTWASLVESGFVLGDRMLYVRRTQMRGDDIAELQRRLNALGFDAGRVDGIFGPRSAQALEGFQRSAGLFPDGSCGPSTVAALHRVGGFASGSVASAREREAIRRSLPRLDGQKVFVAATPGLAVVGEAVVRGLTLARADAILDASGGDDSDLARAANGIEADLYVGLRFGPEAGVRAAFFETVGFRSEAALLFVQFLAPELAASLGVSVEAVGRAYPILRETRMAAVVAEFGIDGDPEAVAAVVSRTGDLARAIVRAIRRAYEAAAPVDD